MLPVLCVLGWTSSARTHEELVSNLVRDGRFSTSAGVAAMRNVDRAHFVPDAVRKHAYDDRPLPLGSGATISAPHMHAAMIDVLEPYLRPGASVLDVGVGSGYLLAVMAQMVGEGGTVHGIDRVPELVELAARNLEAHDASLIASGRATLSLADGWVGADEYAPYDAIHVGAAAEAVPAPLVAQLRPGGRMVVPVGPDGGAQALVQVDKAPDGEVVATQLMAVRFVPLVPGVGDRGCDDGSNQHRAAG